MIDAHELLRNFKQEQIWRVRWMSLAITESLIILYIGIAHTLGWL